ncbi:MAG TPA: hypothetical protein VIG88_09655 [Lysobacter sp.]
MLTLIGTGVLDLTCLSDEFVLSLGMAGYCLASNEDADEVLRCVHRWRDPETSVVIEG